jgi:hypothetical protein
MSNFSGLGSLHFIAQTALPQVEAASDHGQLVGGNLWMNQGGLCHYDPALYQQQILQQQQYQAYKQTYNPPPLPGLVGGVEIPKAKKYVSEYEWLRRRVNEVLWK